MKKTTKKTMFKKIKWHFKEIWKLLVKLTIALICTACGSTKVAVSRPAEGTSTTITVTTNNPITTNVSPEVDATIKERN